MKSLFLTIAACAALAASPARAADCDLSANSVTSGLQTLYDPFSPQNVVVDLQVVVANAGTRPCLARFYVAPLDGTPRLVANGQELAYRIEGGGNGTLPGERGPYVVNVPAGGSETLAIQFTILAQQIVPLGYYTGTLALRGEDAANAPVFLSGAHPVITMSVPARSEMSISGAAAPGLAAQGMAPASINFPDAATGQTGRVFVNVWANSSVRVELRSENGGMLRHLDNGSLPPISYSATFDGTPIGLAGTYAATRVPPMSVAGASYELQVTLGDTSHSFAGLYRDRITVDVIGN